MSVNKDLEIIKHNEPKQIWNQEDGDFYLLFVPEMWDIVIQAAERMAAEIERLKKIIHLCDYCQKEYPTCDAPKDIDFGRGKGNDNVVRCAAFVNGRNLWAEIARLKAELEKRPEVVRCGECKKKDLGFTCPLVCANAVIKAKTKAENFILFDDNDFCSAGQRRESEEGK